MRDEVDENLVFGIINKQLDQTKDKMQKNKSLLQKIKISFKKNWWI